jgi:hypothetical protein
MYTWKIASERASHRSPAWLRPIARFCDALTSRRLMAVLSGGRSHDGWAGPHVRSRAGERGRTLQIKGALEADAYPTLRGQRLSVVVDGARVARVEIPNGAFELAIQLPQVTTPDSIIELRATKSFVPRRLRLNEDRRRLAYRLDALRVV